MKADIFPYQPQDQKQGRETRDNLKEIMRN